MELDARQVVHVASQYSVRSLPYARVVAAQGSQRVRKAVTGHKLSTVYQGIYEQNEIKPVCRSAIPPSPNMAVMIYCQHSKCTWTLSA